MSILANTGCHVFWCQE